MTDIAIFDTHTGTRIGLIKNGVSYCHENCAGGNQWVPLPLNHSVWAGSGCLVCGRAFHAEKRPMTDPFLDHYL